MSTVSGAPTGLVLAAGAGRRLGRGPKALVRIDGIRLVEWVVDALVAGGCGQVAVVTGAGGAEVAAVLTDHPHVLIAHNPAWETGMGSSLRCGLQVIEPGRDVLVMPVDHPGISAAAVDRVIRAHRRGGITAAAYQDSTGQLGRGHPVLFDARWVPAAAAAAHDDVGARDLINKQHETVALVDCSDLDDGSDIDDPGDLRRLSLGRGAAVRSPG